MDKCAIVNYEGDMVYQLVENPVTKIWEDQTAQSIRKNYKLGLNCPCKAYLNEHCDANYKSPFYFTKDYNYFVSKHMASKFHQKWVEHRNKVTKELKENSTDDLVKQVEDLEREKRKDKVDFRDYLEIQAKKHVDELAVLKEKIALQEQLIKTLQSQIKTVPTANLIDIE